MKENHPWVASGDIPADTLLDLRTKDNALSVWHVSEESDNLERLAIGFAANRQRVDKVDCIVFPESMLDELGIKREATDGKTPDDHACKTWHSDLKKLTGSSIVKLAQEIYYNHKPVRFTPLKVRAKLHDALNLGWIEPTKMERTLLEDLGIASGE